MRSLKSTLIYIAITLGFVLSYINKSSAQDSDFATLSREIITRLNGNCRGSTQVRYQSQKLTSPNGLNSVYLNMNIRRFGQVNSRKNDNFIIKCNPNTADKIIGELVIEKNGVSSTTRLEDILGLSNNIHNYVIANPVSFSPDDRYLVLRLDVFDGLNNSWVNHLVIDTLNRYKILAFSNCEGFESNSYLGFISSSEIVFACENPSEPGPIEVFDFQKRSRQKISTRKASRELVRILDKVRSYGSVSSEFAIVDEQHFPPQ
ncbi:hypothetical protein [Coleofasciculus sp. FACHB-1120]|uniref:hypothetical protein n=1 Tax=Coleofasciculus sp. FACHB-1120 TaxID=2692783 RepID=UPI0016835329|nr:hypothetical protein [Coleofasciculus sp. FACHB-1120]MBD2741225.1 hypothetical protein [Coleofasciculus sp. FACHB-1120]